MSRQLLSEEAIEQHLSALPGWAYASEARQLHRRYRFADYAGAFAFAARVSLLAEKRDHHPDLGLGYGYLEVRLTSHDAGGVTEKDAAMAEQIERIATA